MGIGLAETSRDLIHEYDIMTRNMTTLSCDNIRLSDAGKGLIDKYVRTLPQQDLLCDWIGWLLTPNLYHQSKQGHREENILRNTKNQFSLLLL